jgi:hypothetical protein
VPFVEKNPYELCVLVPFQSVSLRLPHPANFALHKLLISGRRHSDKAERDREQAAEVMRALHRAGEDARIQSVFAALPPTWKAQIMRAIASTSDAGVSLGSGTILKMEDTPLSQKHAVRATRENSDSCRNRGS